MKSSGENRRCPPRICFVGLDNYPVLNPACEGYFGGESVQQVLLARAFRDKGYEVCMVVHDHGQPKTERIEGITVHKSYRREAGLRGIRFVHPRLSSLLQSLHVADADCYYQSCAGALTGIVAWYCRVKGRKFVFRTASDTDCVKGRQLIRLKRDRLLYEYGLGRADVISVQSIHQQKLLAENYGLTGILVDMAVEVPEDADLNCFRDIDVLWVNNLRPLKRAEIVLEIAAALPWARFVIIGGVVCGQEGYFWDIRKRAESLDNVQFIGQVPYQRVNDFFSRAKLFINTSEIEGFPNSYLQSWARAVPTVAFFDPDGIINRFSLGKVPADVSEMTVEVGRLLASDSERLDAGLRARRYVCERHAPSVIADSYEQLLSAKDKGAAAGVHRDGGLAWL